MKYIEHLTETEKQTLEELIKHHTCARARSKRMLFYSVIDLLRLMRLRGFLP